MADKTGIEWTDATWNPTVGCSIISPGCTNCYAMKLAGRLEAMGSPIYRGHATKTKAGFVWNGKVSESNWGQVILPLSWKKPRRVFVNSMSDLFHDDMPEETIDRVFAVMALCPQHTFQVLTKRAKRMRDYVHGLSGRHTPDGNMSLSPRVVLAAVAMRERMVGDDGKRVLESTLGAWPLPNVWLGVSVEDQARADERIPLLLETPAAYRFLSCEPLLGPVDLVKARAIAPRDLPMLVAGSPLCDDPYCHRGGPHYPREFNCRWGLQPKGLPGIDWVICGGESGTDARPMHPDWARSLRDQCQAAGVPFFFKQWGNCLPFEWDGDAGPGRSGPAWEMDTAFCNIDQDKLGSATRVVAHGREFARFSHKKTGAVLDGREWREFPA